MIWFERPLFSPFKNQVLAGKRQEQVIQTLQKNAQSEHFEAAGKHSIVEMLNSLIEVGIDNQDDRVNIKSLYNKIDQDKRDQIKGFNLVKTRSQNWGTQKQGPQNDKPDLKDLKIALKNSPQSRRFWGHFALLVLVPHFWFQKNKSL